MKNKKYLILGIILVVIGISLILVGLIISSRSTKIKTINNDTERTIKKETVSAGFIPTYFAF